MKKASTPKHTPPVTPVAKAPQAAPMAAGQAGGALDPMDPVRHHSVAAVSTLYPLPAGHPGAGTLAMLAPMLQAIGHSLSSCAARSPALSGALAAEAECLLNVITAEQSFQRLVTSPQTPDAAAKFQDTAPAMTAVSYALARVAAVMFTAASVEAVHRDHAARELIAGRAWLATDGSIIKDPAHEA